jgi:hypothetical protein
MNGQMPKNWVSTKLLTTSAETIIANRDIEKILGVTLRKSQIQINISG